MNETADGLGERSGADVPARALGQITADRDLVQCPALR
jgi:hypothetical protein